jgi:2-phosphoglycerate kinase
VNKHSFVLALTGPAGAGKSTIGEKLAKQLDSCVNIDADHIKHMVVSGFYYKREKPEDEKEWGFNEWALVGESIGLLARNFLDHGYDVIINGYIDAPGWENIEKSVTITHKILLLPQVDTVIARDAGRPDDTRQGEAAVQRHHRHFSSNEFFKNFGVIDTSHQSIDETVSALRKLLES